MKRRIGSKIDLKRILGLHVHFTSFFKHTLPPPHVGIEVDEIDVGHGIVLRDGVLVGCVSGSVVGHGISRRDEDVETPLMKPFT